MFDAKDPALDDWILVDSEGFAPESWVDDVEFSDVEFVDVVDGVEFSDVLDDGRWPGGSFDVMDGPWFEGSCDVSDGSARLGAARGEVLDALLGMAPGAGVVGRLAGIDAAALGADDAVTFAMVAERAIAWLHSLQDDAVLAAGSRAVQVQQVLVPSEDVPAGDVPGAGVRSGREPGLRRGRGGVTVLRIEDGIREELAAALRWSLSSTADRLAQARLLAGPLARTKEALAGGRIGPGQVRWIVLHAKRLPGGFEVLSGEASDAESAGFAQACGVLQDLVLPVAESGTAARTRIAAERAVLLIDAAGEAVRRNRARKLRDAFVLPGEDGHALFAIRLETERAHACLARVNALAHDDCFVTACDATIGERRAEAAYALLLTEETDESGIPSPRPRAHLDITIDLPTLLGLQDQVEAPASGGVAEIAGIGPVSAGVVRGLLADPDITVTMRRLVTDPITGHLLDLARTTYAIPDRLRAYLTARDRVCRFPGCQRNAGTCQIDHATAWSDGGTTSISNLGSLCTRHHQLKTHGHWTITNSRPDGTCTWESPHRRRYEHEPAAVGEQVRASPSRPEVTEPEPPPF